MLRDRARELLPIIQAFAEGRAIEYKATTGSWRIATGPDWDNDVKYRIKPEPKLVPFTFEDNLIGKTIIHKNSNNKSLIIGQMNNGVYSGTSINVVLYEFLKENYTFEDGCVCGKLVNE